jgi:hypothetical protein
MPRLEHPSAVRLPHLAEGQSAGVVLLVLVAAALVLSPVVFRMPVPARRPEHVQLVLTIALTLVPAAVLAYCFFRERQLELSDKLALFILLAFVVRWMNQLHYVLVDSGGGVFPYSNAVWQRRVHEEILKLSPAELPHSYRFLANAIIRLFEQAAASYDEARWVYRETFVFLLVLASYRYARLYLEHRAAMVSVVLWALVYPFTVLRYAGQPIDPLSHLSFVLAYVFLERRQFVYLLLALLIGSLAKETVLGMAGYFVLFQRSEPRYPLKSTLLVGLALGAYFGVRAVVLRGVPAYAQISGVGFEHVLTNLHSKHWFELTFYSVGLFVPFLALAWRSTAVSLRRTIVYTFVMITASSLLYSWLAETRNLLPVAVPLAVVTAGHLLGWRPSAGEAPPEQPGGELQAC